MLWLIRREILFLFFFFFSVLIMGRGSLKQNNLGVEYVEINHLHDSELLEENLRLRELLELQRRDGQFSTLIAGEIISIRPVIFPSELVVNKGYEQGIAEDMVVLSKNMELLGRVFSVKPASASVMTVFNVHSNISVLVSSTREVGILEGGNPPYLKLKYISEESSLQVGDKVITSGYSDFFPKGVQVGEVARVEEDSKSMFFKVYVVPSGGFAFLDEVLIGYEKINRVN